MLGNRAQGVSAKRARETVRRAKRGWQPSMSREVARHATSGAKIKIHGSMGFLNGFMLDFLNG